MLMFGIIRKLQKGIVCVQVHVMMKLCHEILDLLFTEYDVSLRASSMPLEKKVANMMLIFKTGS